jgi:hypothetical protein
LHFCALEESEQQDNFIFQINKITKNAQNYFFFFFFLKNENNVRSNKQIKEFNEISEEGLFQKH